MKKKTLGYLFAAAGAAVFGLGVYLYTKTDVKVDAETLRETLIVEDITKE